MSSKKVIFIFVFSIIVVLIGGVMTAYSLFAKKNALSARMEGKEPEINALTFYNWWTSPGESAAIKSLVNVFIEKYPDVAVMPTAVIGGAGYSMLGIIKPLVTAGQAPDSFQMHAGYEGMPYYKAGLLDPVDDIWKSEGLSEVVPSVVQDMNRFDGRYYSVPVDIHRVNMLWYNKRVLSEYGIEASDLDNWEKFFAACEKLRTEGMEYPIALGESWTAAHVFEQIMASEGIDFFQDWVNGKIISADDERLVRVFENFKKYLSFTDPSAGDLPWEAAIDLVMSGESAFNVMGDWANQEFKLANKRYNTDYGTMAVPNTSNIYGLCIDTFQRPKNISHPKNANRWLKIVTSREGQDIFNPLKGSISARTDADISRYDAYQQSAISDFWKAKYMFPSVVHGSGAPQSFKIRLGEIISDFLSDRDSAKAISNMSAFTASINEEYAISWSLK